jgi:WD40 repeat protein
MAFSPDGNILALGRCPGRGGGGADIAIFDANTGKYLRVFDTKERCALSLAFNPATADDGTGRYILALVDYENVLALYDMATGKRSAIEGKWGKRNSILSPDGQTFVSTDGYNLWVWSTGTGQLVRTFQEFGIYHTASSADGRMLVVYTWDSKLHVWDMKSGQLVHELDVERPVSAMIVGQDGRLLTSTAGDGAVDVWDMDSGKPPHTFTTTHHVANLALAPDGCVLMLQTIADYTRPKDDELQLWDTNSGQMLRSLEGASGGIEGFAFSPDGNLLASWRACDFVKVWDVKSGRLVHTLGTSDCVTTLAFAPDGRILTAGSKSGVILLWDVSQNHLARKLEGHKAPILGVAFGEDGRKLVSLSQDDMVRVWGVATSAISR